MAQFYCSNHIRCCLRWYKLCYNCRVMVTSSHSIHHQSLYRIPGTSIPNNSTTLHWKSFIRGVSFYTRTKFWEIIFSKPLTIIHPHALSFKEPPTASNTLNNSLWRISPLSNASIYISFNCANFSTRRSRRHYWRFVLPPDISRSGRDKPWQATELKISGTRIAKGAHLATQQLDAASIGIPPRY